MTNQELFNMIAEELKVNDLLESETKDKTKSGIKQ